MNDENKKKYLRLVIGYSGLLLVGLAAVRHITVIQDTIG